MVTSLFSIHESRFDLNLVPPGSRIPDLVAGLKATPGCLGVETARSASGKPGHFRMVREQGSRQALVLQRHSYDGHLNGLSGAQPPEPMQDVPDNSGPIMAIASLTVSDKRATPGMALSVSQISIEPYSPITGGIFVVGRFAPNTLKVPGMKDYTPRR